jgi:hypothetical protein
MPSGCRKVIQDIEKRSDNIMQAVGDAEYKSSLPAPHTLADIKQSLDRNEYKSYSEVRLTPCLQPPPPSTSQPPQFLHWLKHVWTNVQQYFPSHTPLHKAAADMKELSLKLVSEVSGQTAAQLESPAEAMPPDVLSHCASIMLPGANSDSLGFGASNDMISPSMFMSLFPANSFFTNPEASIFNLFMSQPVSSTPATQLTTPLNALITPPPPPPSQSFAGHVHVFSRARPVCIVRFNGRERAQHGSRCCHLRPCSFEPVLQPRQHDVSLTAAANC